MKKHNIEYQTRMTIVNRSEAGPDDPVVMVISDESIDEHNTRFMVNGWDLSYAQRNPVVTYGHPELNSTDDTLYIAKHETYIEDNKLMAKVTFNRDNPRAARIEKAVRNGFMNMASIRASINDAREVKIGDKHILEFTSQQLFDFGIVPHGSNRNAFVESRNTILREITKPQQEEEVMPVQTLNEDQLREYRSNQQRAKDLINKFKKKVNK